MKLTTHAIRNLVFPLLLIFGAWSIVFYFILSDELIDDDILFDEPVRRILFTFKNKAKDFKISTTFILEEKQ